jgi:hypothetical protein
MDSSAIAAAGINKLTYALLLSSYFCHYQEIVRWHFNIFILLMFSLFKPAYMNWFCGQVSACKRLLCTIELILGNLAKNRKIIGCSNLSHLDKCYEDSHEHVLLFR